MQNFSRENKCPKCGTKLGQKNLCPICNNLKKNNENAGKNSSFSETEDYVSQVIDFVKKHPNNWDDEFVVFFEHLSIPLSVKKCYDACALIHRILITDLPKPNIITGSVLVKTITEIQDVFPDISEDRAREISIRLLKSPRPSVSLDKTNYRTNPSMTNQTKQRPQNSPTSNHVLPDLSQTSSWDSFSKEQKQSSSVSIQGNVQFSGMHYVSHHNNNKSSRVADTVKKLTAKQLAIDPSRVTEDARFVNDLNADSLDIVELIMALEEEFNSEIPDEDAMNLRTVGDAIRYIENRINH